MDMVNEIDGQFEHFKSKGGFFGNEKLNVD